MVLIILKNSDKTKSKKENIQGIEELIYSKKPMMLEISNSDLSALDLIRSLFLV